MYAVVFRIVIILCIVVIFICAQLQKTPSYNTKDTSYYTILRELKNHYVYATSFTLGKDEATGKFKNIYLKADNVNLTQDQIESMTVEAVNKELFVTRFESFPIDINGQPLYVGSDNRGDIVEVSNDKNAFSVVGVYGQHESSNNHVFKCPEGFEGIHCQPSPICRPNTDCGAIKLISRNHYRQMKLYNFESREDFTNSSDDYHKRLYVECDNQENSVQYTIHSCRANELINSHTKQCELYDVCADHNDGYRHKLKKPDIEVDDDSFLGQKNTYYECQDGVSVRKYCEDKGLVYSDDSKTCIALNKCYGKGLSRILNHENNDAELNISYIQCSYDTGVKVYCKNGVTVLNDNDDVFCQSTKCHPSRNEYRDPYIAYLQSEVVCVNNVEKKFDCGDNQSQEFSHRDVYFNSTKQSFAFPKWPAKVLKYHSVNPAIGYEDSGDGIARVCEEPTAEELFENANKFNKTKDEPRSDFKVMPFICEWKRDKGGSLIDKFETPKWMPRYMRYAIPARLKENENKDKLDYIWIDYAKQRVWYVEYAGTEYRDMSDQIGAFTIDETWYKNKILLDFTSIYCQLNDPIQDGSRVNWTYENDWRDFSRIHNLIINGPCSQLYKNLYLNRPSASFSIEHMPKCWLINPALESFPAIYIIDATFAFSDKVQDKAVKYCKSIGLSRILWPTYTRDKITQDLKNVSFFEVDVDCQDYDKVAFVNTVTKDKIKEYEYLLKSMHVESKQNLQCSSGSEVDKIICSLYKKFMTYVYYPNFDIEAYDKALDRFLKGNEHTNRSKIWLVGVLTNEIENGGAKIIGLH